MNALDLVLVIAVFGYALSGYRQGFLVGSASTVGLLAGGFLGARLVPYAMDELEPGLAVSVGALLVVLACAFVGQALGVAVGSRLRNHVRWRPARFVDALSGAGLSVAAMLLIAWVLGVAASGVQLRSLNQEVRNSVVLGAVDRVLPGGSDRVMSAFNSVVDSSRFPSYLDPFTSERIKDVPAPTSGIVDRAGVVHASDSVVKVLGDATACGRSLEGSGFVYAPGRVMTNAHVVAGVDSPHVLVDGAEYAADVVYFDPDVDVAVLYTPELAAPTLDFGTSTESGQAVAVLGFPENGPYDVRPARVRDEQTLRSPDIYGDATVVRTTLSIYAHVRPGNSGGPLVDARGDVVGVVFAASVTDATTGYALTAGQVAAAASAGARSTSSVDTEDCSV